MSRRFLKQALYSTHKLFEYAHDLSFKSRADYEKDIKLMMHQLHDAGIQISHIKHLKERHITHLISLWNSQGLNPGTIKNRLSKLRYVCAKINKSNIMPKTNHTLPVAKRRYYSGKNRAIDSIDVSTITDQHVKYSLLLQQQFGLRREESIKFIPKLADKGHAIELKKSWTKGGVGRTIPITTLAQRQLLDELHRFLKPGASLIPVHKQYIDQENTYVSQTRQAGFKNLHGLRHAYAQRRYKILTDHFTNDNGWECPFKGGKSKDQLSAVQRKIDTQVRFLISSELGHSRISIVKNYLS